MNWLILVAITVLFDSTRIFIDNYVSDVYFKKIGAVSQKLFYSYAFLIIGSGILIFNQFNFLTADYAIIGLLLLSGCLSSIAGIPYYKALEIEDSTNLSIFIQLAPVFYLILGWFFLGEYFSPIQLIAFLIILAAPFLIIINTRKRSRKTKLKAVVYALIYVIVAVIANLIFVKANNGTMLFANEMSFYFLSKGVTNLIIVHSRPKWRKKFITVLKESKCKVLRPMLVNATISSIKDFAYRGALIAAPTVALASAATDSAVPIAVFFLGIVFTLIWPKFGREKLDRKSIIVHLVATILVVTGIILLQF